jgi:hypothetical protein
MVIPGMNGWCDYIFVVFYLTRIRIKRVLKSSWSTFELDPKHLNKI